ncbi:MAG: hypothetical protein ACXVH3_33255, partial [Solirubrobacteraceae bacterium]
LGHACDSQACLRAAGGRAGSKHIGGSCNRGKAGPQPIPPERPTVDDATVPEIGDEQGAHGPRGADLLCFHGGCGSGVPRLPLRAGSGLPDESAPKATREKWAGAGLVPESLGTAFDEGASLLRFTVVVVP